MMAALSDPALLAAAFTASVFAAMGAFTLAGLVRALRTVRGRVVHLLTLACGSVALVVLALLALGIETGFGIVLGFAAGVGAICFWLVGALIARARPPWVDLLVILAATAFLTSYAAIADHDGTVPRVFPGLTLPGPDDPP